MKGWQHFVKMGAMEKGPVCQRRLQQTTRFDQERTYFALCVLISNSLSLLGQSRPRLDFWAKIQFFGVLNQQNHGNQP